MPVNGSPIPPRQSVIGPRTTPAPRSGVNHVASFRAAVSHSAPRQPVSRPLPDPLPAGSQKSQGVGHKSTVRGPRPRPSASSSSSYSSSSSAMLQRRRAVSRTSRTSTTSTAASSLTRPPLPFPPSSPPSISSTARKETVGALSDSGTDPTSPELTIEWFPDPESKRLGSIDQAEETWKRMEERMGTKLREGRRERGRWVVTPRVQQDGATPRLGSVDFPTAIPTGPSHPRNSANDEDDPGTQDSAVCPGGGLSVEVQSLSDDISEAPSPTGSTNSSHSDFSISAYLDNPSRTSSSSLPSPAILEEMPVVFDMTLPLISHSIGKTPVNSPRLDHDTLKRSSHVAKRRDLLEVEYLGGGGMLVREESLRSVVSRVDAVTRRALGQSVKVAEEKESVLLDAQILDARMAFACPDTSLPPSRCGSPLSELIVDYVTSPPVAVTWAPPPRLPLLPAPIAAPIPTPRSVASVALEEMYDFLNHQQSALDVPREEPQPQYTDRIYGSPESVDLPPLPLGTLPPPRDGNTTPSGLGLGMQLRLSSIYGVPSLTSARVKLVSPRAEDMRDTPLPFALPDSPSRSPIVDFSCPLDEVDMLETIVIKDLDTGVAVNLPLAPPDRASPRTELKREKKWWSKKFFK